MFKKLILICFSLILAMGAAESRPGHGGAPRVVTNGPVLASAVNTFGNLTKQNYGGERLSRTNQNYGARYSPYGTGILVSGSCAKWTTTQIGGTSGHFNLISHVVEGTSAVTPTPTASGVSAHLTGGPYTFLVSCEDSSNAVLTTSTLTYNINDGDNHCGAVNIGSTDLVNIQFYPTGFASTIDGCYIQMSTGFYKTARFGIGLGFPHRTYLTFADPARPGELQDLETNTSSTNATVKDVMVLPAGTDTAHCSGCLASFVLAGIDTNAENIHSYATAAMRLAGSHGCVTTSGTVTTTAHVTNFGCEYLSGFFSPTSGYTYQYGWSRYVQSDAIISMSAHNFRILDVTIMQFRLPGANHPDIFQIADGATPSDYEVKRLMAISAASDIAFQGPMFGGGPTGALAPLGYGPKGFISDSTCSGAAGQTLCTVLGGIQSNGNISSIYSTAGSPLGPTDGIKVNCGASLCPTGSRGFTGNASGTTNLTVSNLISTGKVRVGNYLYGAGVPPQTTIVSQTSGTSGLAGVYVTSNPITATNVAMSDGYPYPLIGLSGNVTLGSAASPVPIYGLTNINSNWDMIWNSGWVIQGNFMAGFGGGTGVYTHYDHINELTPGQSSIGPPRTRFVNCQTAGVWLSGLAVSKGAEFDTWDSDCAVTTNPPAGSTVSNVFSALKNATTYASWYANGNPETCMEAKTANQWDAMSVQAIMIYAATCTVVKTGGPLDLGGGDFASSMTDAATPTWNDGTIVGTGFNGQ